MLNVNYFKNLECFAKVRKVTNNSTCEQIAPAAMNILLVFYLNST